MTVHTLAWPLPFTFPHFPLPLPSFPSPPFSFSFFSVYFFHYFRREAPQPKPARGLRSSVSFSAKSKGRSPGRKHIFDIFWVEKTCLMATILRYFLLGAVLEDLLYTSRVHGWCHSRHVVNNKPVFFSSAFSNVHTVSTGCWYGWQPLRGYTLYSECNEWGFLHS